MEIKLILLCSSRLALPSLKELLFYKRLAVIAIPDFNEDMITQVQLLLEGLEVPLLQVNETNCNTQLVDAIERYHVNIGLIMSFSYKISSQVYTLPAKGFFNVHPGPLPEYRGADPVFQQIKNREKYAAVCIHKLDQGFDTGPIVIQEMVRIEKNDTYGLLTTKLAALATGMVATLMKLASFDIAIPSKAQDRSRGVYYKKQMAKDVTINWQTMDADTIVALINACNPWNKGAVTKLNNNILRLLEAENLNENTSQQKIPGTIIAFEENGMIVATCDDSSIRVSIVYIDEGYLTANRLTQLGVVPGSSFEVL